MTEREVLHDVLATVGAMPGFRFWRINTGLYFTPEGQRVRTSVKGSADITGVGPGGRRIELEVKRPGARPSPEQETFGRVIAAHGGVYAVVHSGTEARDVLAREFA